MNTKNLHRLIEKYEENFYKINSGNLTGPDEIFKWKAAKTFRDVWFSEEAKTMLFSEKFNLAKKKLKLEHNLFDNDALFFETEIDKVKLKSSKSKNYIEVAYKDMTCLGLWHKPKAEAPYICIEPWHGIPSTDGVVDDLKNKEQMINLAPNKKYSNTYTIKVVEK